MDCLVNINWNKVTPCLVLLLLDLVLDFSECTTQAEVNKHLELGRDFLSRGQLSDALTHYHAAVEGDPHNYLTYFKRGTVYYALGKAKFALQDFSKVLELKPDFTAARVHRAEVYLKLAEYMQAKEDFIHVMMEEPYNEEAASQAALMDALAEEARLADAYARGGDWAAAAHSATRLLERSPWAARLRRLRADCRAAAGDPRAAAADLRALTRLLHDDTDGYLRLAKLLVQLGEVGDALKEIRECLKLDPEHKQCFPMYKQLKKVDKAQTQCEGGDCDACATLLRLDDAPHVVFHARRHLCSCALKEERYSEALSECEAALRVQRDADVLCDKAEALIGLEMFDDAVRAYQEAAEGSEGSEGSRRAAEGLERARRLQRTADRRDYYKILGVKRSASKQEIIKAYRKAAQKWHPDNFQGDDKKIAEKKFIDIAAAKEVLTDPEKRAQFDSGVDPLDPENGRQQFQQNPFHHFQHGSPFQFKFHFN